MKQATFVLIIVAVGLLGWRIWIDAAPRLGMGDQPATTAPNEAHPPVKGHLYSRSGGLRLPPLDLGDEDTGEYKTPKGWQ